MKLTAIITTLIILAMFSVIAIIDTDLATKSVTHTVTAPKTEVYSYATSISKCATPFAKAHTELMLKTRSLSKLELDKIKTMATELCKQNPGLSYD